MAVRVAQDTSRRLRSVLNDYQRAKEELQAMRTAHDEVTSALRCLQDDTKDLRESEGTLRDERGRLLSVQHCDDAHADDYVPQRCVVMIRRWLR